MIEVNESEIRRKMVSFREQKKSHRDWARLRSVLDKANSGQMMWYGSSSVSGVPLISLTINQNEDKSTLFFRYHKQSKK